MIFVPMRNGSSERLIIVPEVGELIRLILEEAHCSRYSIHPGTTKMYHDLSQHYWLCGMKRDIADFFRGV